MSLDGMRRERIQHHCDMGRVLWINGCFSTGKTAVATLLAERLGGSFLHDPEVIGACSVTVSSPRRRIRAITKYLSLWRTFTRDAVVNAAEHSDGVVVVPMTIARHEYFHEVVVAVRRRVPLDHFTLTASRETILARESRRPDDTADWAEKTVDWVLPALADSRFAVHIDAESTGAAGSRGRFSAAHLDLVRRDYGVLPPACANVS